MNEENLRKYKLDYREIHVPENVVEAKWDVVVPMLGTQENIRFRRNLLPYALLFLTILILISSFIGLTRGEQVRSAVSGVADKFINSVSNPKNEVNVEKIPQVNISSPTATPTQAAEKKEEVKGIETQGTNSGNNLNGKEQGSSINEENNGTNAGNSGLGNSGEAHENKDKSNGKPENPGSDSGKNSTTNSNHKNKAK